MKALELLKKKFEFDGISLDDNNLFTILNSSPELAENLLTQQERTDDAVADYNKMHDAFRVERALEILENDEVSPYAGAFLRCLWTGNYGDKGTPIFHILALAERQDEFLAQIKYNRQYFMSVADRAAFDELPEVIRAFRGGDSDGVSWSLSRDVAGRFGRLSYRTIQKTAVFALLIERDEQEIILL